jgi:hypothetical protein
VWEEEETILTAEFHLGRIAEESLTLDVTGPYHRPNLFDFQDEVTATFPYGTSTSTSVACPREIQNTFCRW